MDLNMYVWALTKTLLLTACVLCLTLILRHTLFQWILYFMMPGLSQNITAYAFGHFWFKKMAKNIVNWILLKAHTLVPSRFWSLGNCLLFLPALGRRCGWWICESSIFLFSSTVGDALITVAFSKRGTLTVEIRSWRDFRSSSFCGFTCSEWWPRRHMGIVMSSVLHIIFWLILEFESWNDVFDWCTVETWSVISK